MQFHNGIKTFRYHWTFGVIDINIRTEHYNSKYRTAVSEMGFQTVNIILPLSTGKSTRRCLTFNHITCVYLPTFTFLSVHQTSRRAGLFGRPAFNFIFAHVTMARLKTFCYTFLTLSIDLLRDFVH